MARPGRIAQSDLKITRLLWIFAALSIALTAALAVVPARARATEWRTVQEKYNSIARRRHKRTLPIALQQIWKPELEVVDRCTSCHVAMGDAEPMPGRRLFARHPEISHDPREFGCTMCHEGQGRATSEAAAHGDVAHWDDPILRPGTFEAGCGNCHSHIPVPAIALFRRGRQLYADSKCAACHRVEGAGGDRGPDLSWVGLAGFRADWYTDHSTRSMQAAESDPWATGFTPLADDEVSAVDEYLHALVGAPRLLEGKSLAHELGCRGCHRIGGVGGDDGPELSDVGRKAVADLDFSRVPGKRTLRNWLRQHFLDPARVVPGSRMPNLHLSEPQADSLTVYMLSLRDRTIPEAAAPRDRVRGARLDEREFATDGESLYGVFCAACHGPRGSGRRFGNPEVTFPAIGNPDFLAVTDVEQLRRTITAGRPGRPMPAWGTKDGGLRPEEIVALATYLESLEPAAPSFEEVMAAGPDVDRGGRLFARDCSTCHGESGGGTVVAPPLAAEDNPVTGNDNALYGTLTIGVAGTAMGPFRRYDAADLRAVIAAVRALPRQGAQRAGWSAEAGDSQRGARTFARVCAECHGARGEGPRAPALANAAFLASVPDGYLAATIVRGRADTRMPAFGSPPPGTPKLDAGEVSDVVAFLRSVSPVSHGVAGDHR